MVFSSPVFLYAFFPLLCVCYFICKSNPYRQIVLTIFSLLFYAWGEPRNLFLMLALVAVDYGFGLFLSRTVSPRKRKGILLVAVAVNLSVLVFYKYLGFFCETLGTLTGLSLPVLSLPLPIGISFFTFQTMSYVIDVYRGDAAVQTSYGKLLLYVSFFPQLIAGPIVRYKDIEEQLPDRSANAQDILDGLFHFSIGLCKKLLIADRCEEALKLFYGLEDVTVAARWLGALFFTLQLYFDFSGYSDMAIGLGQVFGFRFLENFRYPLCADSATDFWRRWHISLGSFFRDYVYIPLGGNRRHPVRNIFIVWLLTGLWHGASWNYLLWGLFYAVLLALEKWLLLPLRKKLEKHACLRILASLFSRLLCFVCTVFGFAIFYFEQDLWQNLGYLFGIGTSGFSDLFTVSVFFRYLFLLMTALLFAAPVAPYLGRRLHQSLLEREEWDGPVFLCYNVERIGKTVLTLAGIAAATACMVGNTYSAFLYFRY